MNGEDGNEEKKNNFMIDVEYGKWKGRPMPDTVQTVKIIAFSHNLHNMYTDERTDDKVP